MSISFLLGFWGRFSIIEIGTSARATHPNLSNPITIHPASVTALCRQFFRQFFYPPNFGASAAMRPNSFYCFAISIEMHRSPKMASWLFINIQCVRSLVNALTLAKSKLTINCLHWVTVFCCMHLSIYDIIRSGYNTFGGLLFGVFGWKLLLFATVFCRPVHHEETIIFSKSCQCYSKSLYAILVLEFICSVENPYWWGCFVCIRLSWCVIVVNLARSCGVWQTHTHTRLNPFPINVWSGLLLPFRSSRNGWPISNDERYDEPKEQNKRKTTGIRSNYRPA